MRSKKRLIAYASFVISVLICYVIMTRRTFVRYEDRIPYVWNVKFNRTLGSYLRTRPSRNVLVLTGPYQCGKSRAMNIMTRELTSSGRLAINVDFSVARTPKQAVGLIRLAVLQGLAELRSNLTLSTARRAADKLGALAETKAIQPMDRVSEILEKVLSEAETTPFAISKFFDCLETVAVILKPVVFAHAIDTLKSVAPELFDAAEARLSRRAIYRDSVPVVCEVKDSSFRVEPRPLGDAVRVFEVGELIDPVYTLVVKTQAFSAIEVGKITDRFGGHGGTFERVFEDIKMGVDVDESVEKQSRLVHDYVTNMIDETQMEVIANLCLAENETTEMEVEELKLLSPLFRTGHLYLSHDRTVVFANKVVREALCQTADTPTRDED